MEERKLKMIKFDNFPSYALTYLLYGDSDGMEEEDIANFEKWSSSFKNGIAYTEYVEGGDDEFCRYQAFGLACSTVTVNVFYY